MKSILVIGDIYAETQYFVDKIPTQDEFTFASDATSIYGSKTVNASRVLSRLGNVVSFFAHAGSDTDGNNAKQALTGWKIVSLMKHVSEEKTGKIVVITDQSAKSSITLFRGANQTVSTASINELKHIITKQDAVYAATNLPLESLYLLVQICIDNHVPLLIDVPNQHESLDLSKLSSADFFIPNRQESELLLKNRILTVEDAKSVILTMRKKFKGTIIISLDKDGCLLLEKNNETPTHLPATAVKSVDETASGDILRASFLHHFLISKNIEESLRKAIFIASESTKIKGVDNTLTTVSLK